MRIEAGKTYMSREGKLVYITQRHPSLEAWNITVGGYRYYSNGLWQLGTESPQDLIREAAPHRMMTVWGLKAPDGGLMQDDSDNSLMIFYNKDHALAACQGYEVVELALNLKDSV